MAAETDGCDDELVGGRGDRPGAEHGEELRSWVSVTTSRRESHR
jgi:hypothetical protein